MPETRRSFHREKLTLLRQLLKRLTPSLKLDLGQVGKLLNKQLIPMLALGAKRGIAMKLTANGSVVNPSIIDQLSGPRRALSKERVPTWALAPCDVSSSSREGGWPSDLGLCAAPRAAVCYRR